MYKVPGVYIEPDPQRIAPIAISRQCLTGFVGLAEKGPIHTGVTVKSFYEFQKIFGDFTSYSVLAYSVYGFFNSGGKECVVVRTAHIDNENETNSVSRSSLQVYDNNSKAAFTLAARSEGMWGNEIQVRLWYQATEHSPVSVCGGRWVDVEDAEDFTEGETVRIKGKDRSEFAVIANIRENRLYFHTPLKSHFDSDHDKLSCEIVTCNFAFIHNRKVEEFFCLSTNKGSEKYFINEINKMSNLVEIIDVENNNLPQEVNFKFLRNGRNGILGITPADFIGSFRGFDDSTGLGIFESFPDVRLICIPDIVVFEELVHNEEENALKDIEAVQRAVVDHCERVGNRFAILDLPDIKDPLKISKWTGKFDSHSAAVYYPRIEIMNPDDISGITSVVVPNSGHIAGIFADTDSIKGVFHPPANRFINGAVGLTSYLNDDIYEAIYPKGINILRYISGRGIKIWGARTLSSDPEWRYINVRRTFSGICNAIKAGAAWAVFETNSPNLQKRIIRHVTAFLLDRWKEGYFSGNSPDKAFYVKCDEELNPVENIEEGIVTVEVGIAITRPAEFFVMKIKANSTETTLTVED